MKKLILISAYENGVLKDIKKRYPRTDDGAVKMMEEIADETDGDLVIVNENHHEIYNGNMRTKIEIVNRF